MENPGVIRIVLFKKLQDATIFHMLLASLILMWTQYPIIYSSLGTEISENWLKYSDLIYFNCFRHFITVLEKWLMNINAENKRMSVQLYTGHLNQSNPIHQLSGNSAKRKYKGKEKQRMWKSALKWYCLDMTRLLWLQTHNFYYYFHSTYAIVSQRTLWKR